PDERLVVHALRRRETFGGIVDPGQTEREPEVGGPLEQVPAVGNQSAKLLARVAQAEQDAQADPPDARLGGTLRSLQPPVVPGLGPLGMIDAVTLGVVRFLIKCDANRTRGAEPAVAEGALRGHLDRDREASTGQ